MADIAIYKQVLGLSTVEEIVEDFLRTIILTNHDYAYFVDWAKVDEHVNEVRVELNILNSLLNASNASEAEERYRELVHRYPETVRALPILIACRTNRLEVLSESQQITSPLFVRFTPDVVRDPKAFESLMTFCREVGIFSLFAEKGVTDLVDYVMGVEVGLDTHTRKNRSGDAMERMVEPFIAAAVADIQHLELIPQCTREKLKEKGYSAPIEARQMDFVVISKAGTIKPLNIETNFFNVTGSKQDVITGYVDRQRRLQRAGWSFVIVTDGPAWRQMESSLTDIVTELEFVINISQLRRGMLRAILKTLAR